MLELLHAVITSLLLSIAAGFGADTVATSDEEPANSETGVEVGKLPAQLAVPRVTKTQTKSDQDDDHQPTALAQQAAFCEPTVCIDNTIASATHLPLAVSLTTAGRSP